jgi:hypothetical protein
MWALVLGAAVAALSPLRAQAGSGAQQPEGRLVLKEKGFSLDLAGGFQLGMERDGYYLLGSKATAGLILVRALPGLTADELSRNLRSGYSDRTLQLTPEASAEEFPIQGGSARLAEVSGFLMEDAVRGLLAGYLRPEEGGVLLFAVTTPEQWPELRPAARQIAESVVLFDTDPTELIEFWEQRLSGYQLLYAPEGSDPKDAREIFHFCGDGGLFHERPAAEPPADRTGNWKIVVEEGQAVISFTFADGTGRSHELRREDLHTYLGGRRYFVLPTERCR